MVVPYHQTNGKLWVIGFSLPGLVCGWSKPSAIPPDDVTSACRANPSGGYREHLPSARSVTLQIVVYASLLCSYLVGVTGLGLLGRLLAWVMGQYAAQQTALMTAG